MKKKELSVWDFVAGKTSEYEECQYICMDDKNEVAFATDRKILFVNPQEYRKFKHTYINETMEKRKFLVVDKEGRLMKYTFPNWQSIIPTEENRKPLEFLPEAQIRKAIKEAEALCKWEVNTRFKKKYMEIYLGNDIWMPLDRVKKMLVAGLDNWFCRDKHYISTLFKQWDGKTMSVMCSLNADDYSEKYKELGFASMVIYQNDLIELYKLYKETKEFNNNKK